MWQQLSGVSIVLFIAAGVQTVLLLFIFAKRQIMRFTLRSRRGPHTPIAQDAKKSLQKEITRRIELIPKIQYEPPLGRLLEEPDAEKKCHYYRLKTLVNLKRLEQHIAENFNGLKRQPRENIRPFLITNLCANFSNNRQHLIHQFCDIYEHARHDPSDFKEEDYEKYLTILHQLLEIH